MHSWHARLHYALGNCARFASSPWLQRSISPDTATTIFGCGFGAEGWHHLRRTLEEYDKDPAINPEVTPLWRFLKSFCPASISILAGVASEEPLPLFVYPWGTFNSGGVSRNKDPMMSRFCGPSSDSFVFEEYKRTIELYKSVSANGYRPYQYPNSFIGGTWLIAADGEKRFVVMQGNHRMAALAHLGYKAIPVRRIRQALPIVRETDLPSWHTVKNGRCSEAHARRVFKFFFEQNGRHVAAQIGTE